MLPAAKVLLVTVLLGGGTVGTYALAGGKFGSGGSGNGETTAQASTPEVTTPAPDVQPQPRVEEEAPASPREEEIIEGNAQNRGSSDTLSGVGREEIPGSTDSSHSAKGGPGVESEEVVTVPQKNSQEETTSAGDGQEPSGPKAPGVSEGDAEGEKTSLEVRSNEPGTVEDAGAQTGNQGVVAERREDQVAENLLEANVGRDGQPAAAPLAQDQEDVNGVNQVDKAVTPNENTNTGGSNPVEETQA